jgi:hypothetical protein
MAAEMTHKGFVIPAVRGRRLDISHVKYIVEDE